MGHVVQDPGDHALADDEHDGHEAGQLEEGQAQGLGEIDHGDAAVVTGLEEGRQRRNENQRHDHGDVLDDEPADGDAPALGLDEAPLLEGAQQNDRARDGQSEPKDETRPKRPAKAIGEAHPEQRGDRDLRHGAGNGDGFHRQQVVEGEVQPNAEHEEDDAHLGELVGEILVGDVARREGADDDAGDEVPDKRRHAQALRERGEHPGEGEARDDRRYERCVVNHRSLPSSA